jgi:hypothetical protein
MPVVNKSARAAEQSFRSFQYCTWRLYSVRDMWINGYGALVEQKWQLTINQPANHLTNQPTNQLQTNQPTTTNQPTKQPTN